MRRPRSLNYRHGFHAGNFADLLKHAIWLELLVGARANGGPRLVLETHAGAGLYDLSGDMASRSSEAKAGIGVLAAGQAPPLWLARLRQEVAALNPSKGAPKLYPGSPMLAAAVLSPRDHMLLYELRADDAAALQAALRTAHPSAASRSEVRVSDGYGHPFQEGRGPGQAVCLVDPPFETGQDAEEIFGFAARYVAAFPRSPLAIWAPLKDLESYDYLLRGLEALGPGRVDALVSAEVRLRSLWDPMRMNGCGVILINSGLSAEPGEELETVCSWIAQACGDVGARAVVRRLGRG